MWRIFCAVIAVLFISGVVYSDDLQGKKIVIMGGIGGSGGQPSPTELKGMDYGYLDALPIDGLVYSLTNNGGLFCNKSMDGTTAYTYDQIAPDTETMQNLGFKNLKDNFIRIYVAAELSADWYDDAAWKVILSNLRLASRAAKEAGAVGFIMDTEQYNYQPFNYTAQPQRLTKDFDAYRAQVRKRGKEFMEALSSSLPSPKLLFTYSNSAVYMWGGKTPLYARGTGLFPAFLDGLMDGNPTAEFIDGFEQSYYYRSYSEYKEGREAIINKAASLSQNPKRYKKRIKVGYGIWLVETGKSEGNLNTDDYTLNSFTPDELKHALHYALKLSDGYVWLYSVPWFTLPEEYLAAVEEARNPQPLDFKPAARPVPESRGGYIISAKGRLDSSDEVVFAAYKQAGYRELYDFPKVWRFRLDPQDKGISDTWFEKYNSGDWMDIEIGEWWEPQLKTNYWGYAWYRFELDAPKDWAGKKLYLSFGAVDEEAWIWINGQKAGEHALGPEGWNTTFDIDVTEKVLPGKKNTIYVRVNNSAGVGGIWKSVKIFTK